MTSDSLNTKFKISEQRRLSVLKFAEPKFYAGFWDVKIEIFNKKNCHFLVFAVAGFKFDVRFSKLKIGKFQK